jgi:2-polyprenyl-6-methoxyphenol hydroxylase-like FAD-dependent oxidoreductase
MAGLSAALLLARDGHRVTIVERDGLDAGAPLEAPGWERKGIPHFLQPHAFIPRGCAELKRHLPDVHDNLLAAGAQVVEVWRKLPGPIEPSDAELEYLGVRRPLIEWGLRRAVGADTRIQRITNARVTGLELSGRRVGAVRIGDHLLDADLVVDALGRRSPTFGWLAGALGESEQPPETSDCGVIYYSRYYQQRSGFELPDGRWLLSPRGDLGYAGFASFPGDNGTFAGLLAVPTGVGDWMALKDPAAFEGAIALIPMMRLWIDSDGVDPITGVMPMAGLRNSIRRYDPSWVTGFVPIGDARCHTDPVLAHGLSFALIHAIELARSLREHGDDVDGLDAFAMETEPAIRERYDLATELDEQRHRGWTGGAVEPRRHDGDYALFSTAAAGAAAFVDPDVFRVFVRRIGLLDSTTVLDGDVELQGRIERILSESTPPTAVPSRDEMLDAMSRASAVASA